MNYSPELHAYVVLPLLIALARVCDVSIGTLRIIFVARGRKRIAPVLGFVEVFIWVVAIGQIMQNLSNWVAYFAYAGGFALGNFVGMWLEEKLAIGVLVVRVITRKDAAPLIAHLREQDLGVTVVDAVGATGPVNIIYTVIERQDLRHVIATINEFNPHAFYSVEDVRQVREGIFPRHDRAQGRILPRRISK